MPEISIILPVYNVERYVAKCIDSILAQSFIDFELIVVNDGSTDKSLEICENYTDSRLLIINKINGGVSSARNAGLEIAKGKYITFVDSDDYVSQNYLSDLMKTDNDLVCQTAVFVNESGEILQIPYKNSSKQEIAGVDLKNNILDYLLSGRFNWTFCKRFVKELVFNYNIRFNEKLDFAEDTLFTVSYAVISKSILVDNIANYNYVHYNTRQTLSNVFSLEKIGMLEKSNHIISAVLAGNNLDFRNFIFASRMVDVYNSMIGYYIKKYSLREFDKNVKFAYKLADNKDFLLTCRIANGVCLPKIIKRSIVFNKKYSIPLAFFLYSIWYYCSYAYHQLKRLALGMFIF